MVSRVLVAGIGNIFLGDDGFGPEVVQQIALPEDDPAVRVTDYGIAGIHLVYDLLEGWDALVLIDAIPSRGNPGTVHVFQADNESHLPTVHFDGRWMDPATIFASLDALGGTAPFTIVVGCEAGNVDEGIGLTEPVADAVPRAARAVEKLIAALRFPSPAAWVGEAG